MLSITRENISDSQVPEICNNAIDDDGDGLIDINDDDCFCPRIEPIPVSFIPNPSFEEQDCCPEGNSNLNCATDWDQASAATTDYFHICDYSGQDIFDIPQPLPDGEGFVGFFDGFFPTEGDPRPDLKEYAGACLTDTLKIATFYRLQFYMGFLDGASSPATDVAIFGTVNCDNLPFGEEDMPIGCPTDSPGWIRLGAVSVFGNNEWKKFSINFESDLPITAIALGPDCAQHSLPQSPYYFLDQLILAEDRDFDVRITDNDQPCAADFALELIIEGQFGYQWYKDGIAIVGATMPILLNLPGSGDYQVRVENQDGCRISDSYIHNLPFKTVRTSETICAGEFHFFNNQNLIESGIYFDTLKTLINCDSIIRLELEVDQSVESFVTTKFFPLEAYTIGNLQFDKPGEYDVVVPSLNGCDSIVHLDLDYYHVYIPNAFTPNADGVNDRFVISGEQDLAAVTSLKIFSRWGDEVYAGNDLALNEGWDGRTNSIDANPGVYFYIVDVRMVDGAETSFSGDLTLIR